MRKLFLCILLISTINFFNLPVLLAQGVAINENGNSPHASAMLDVESSAKGLLIPRLTKFQRDAIVSPATGLMIYQTDNTTGFHYYDGTAWTYVGGANSIDELSDGKSDGTNVFLGAGAGDNDYGYNYNAAVGKNALYSNTTGRYNTATGFYALYSNTTGGWNTANGERALVLNTTGSYNTATGTQTLYRNTSGNQNTAIGYQSLFDNITGSWNTAIGHRALFNNTTGYNNVANGFAALSNNTTGRDNTAYGSNSNYHNQTGSYNTIIGSDAGRGTTNHNKSGNVFLGFQAGYYDTTDNKLYIENSNSTTPLIWGDFANDTVRINGTLDIRNEYSFPIYDGFAGQLLQTDGNGVLNWVFGGGGGLQWSDTLNQLATDYDVSMKQNISDTSTVDATRYWVGQQGYLNTVSINDLTDGIYDGESVFLGAGAGSNDIGGSLSVAFGKDALYSNTMGAGNTAIGYQALYSNTEAFENTATGFQALYSNTEGLGNTAIGSAALYKNLDGGVNIAIGTNALYNNTTGIENTAIGSRALYNNNSESNIAIGSYALYNNTTGAENTAFGHYSDNNNQAGSYNTIIGYKAGHGTSLHNKSGNVFLGYKAGYNELGDNKLYIENSNSTTPLIWGDFTNDSVRINGTLNINSAYSFPVTDGSIGYLLKTDGNGNLVWGNNPGSTALQWADTSNQLATDYDVSLKQNISDTSTVDATRYWVGQQGYLTTALQWSDTSSQLATDHDVSFKQNISDTSTVDATRYWVGQQGYLSTVSIDSLTDGKADGYSVFLGSTAGANNLDYTYNVGVGIGALTTNSSGDLNTAIGYEALRQNSTGTSNTAIGYQSLYNNTTGFNNSAIGDQVLYNNKTGRHNSAIGYGSLFFNNSGEYNVAFGYKSSYKNTTGDENTSIGCSSNYYNQTGRNNTIIGYEAGMGTYDHSKSGNVFIGHQAGYNEYGNNKLYIENSNSSTPLIHGDFDTDKVTINDVLNLAPRTSAPTSPAEGDLYVNSTDDHIYCFLNGIWKQLD